MMTNKYFIFGVEIRYDSCTLFLEAARILFSFFSLEKVQMLRFGEGFRGGMGFHPSQRRGCYSILIPRDIQPPRHAIA